MGPRRAAPSPALPFPGLLGSGRQVASGRPRDGFRQTSELFQDESAPHAVWDPLTLLEEGGYCSGQVCSVVRVSTTD